MNLNFIDLPIASHLWKISTNYQEQLDETKTKVVPENKGAPSALVSDVNSVKVESKLSMEIVCSLGVLGVIKSLQKYRR